MLKGRKDTRERLQIASLVDASLRGTKQSLPDRASLGCLQIASLEERLSVANTMSNSDLTIFNTNNLVISNYLLLSLAISSRLRTRLIETRVSAK